MYHWDSRLETVLTQTIFRFAVALFASIHIVATAEQEVPPKLFFSVMDLGSEVKSLQAQKDEQSKALLGSKLTQLALSVNSLVAIDNWQPTEEDCLDFDERVVPVSLKALTDGSVGDRQNALRIILSIGEVRARAELPPLNNLEESLITTLQRETDHEARNLTMRALQSVGVLSISTLTTVVSAAIQQQLDTSFLRDAFILVAENAESTPSALDLLLKYSHHDAIPVQRAALRAIYKCPIVSPAIVQRLLEALQSPNFPVRQAAVFALQGNSVSQAMSVSEVQAIANEATNESQDMGVSRGCLTVLAVAAQFKHRAECVSLLMQIALDQTKPQELRSDAVNNFAMIANLESEYVRALNEIGTQEKSNPVGISARKVVDYLQSTKIKSDGKN
ncbi:MAG: HEAT repeat domain-containing protein [Candidatus Hydrogenedentes bacterium]|nr:HEAT repeat domain-containing protein [Candidatus Hydrogenedentota bacterium]